jgi:uncharacterized protein
MSAIRQRRTPSDPAAIQHGPMRRPDPAPASAIYEGWVRHRRYAPHAHAFRYRIAMIYLDLAELDGLIERRWLWSRERRNLAQFRRRDYLGPYDMPLDEAVRQRVANYTGRRPDGPIRMLAHLRYFGHCFNPVTFYYCFESDGCTLSCVVAEITNTPWKERHAYVLPMDEGERHGGVTGWRFDKAFHVSPFMPMDREYDWRFNVPDAQLRVQMNVLDKGERHFDATLVLDRRRFNGTNLARVLWRFPLMTLKVVAAIHFEALRIFMKRNPVHDHPLKAKR